MFFILSIFTILWIILFIEQIYIVYKQNSKPYLSDFLAFSLKDVPNNRKSNELSLLVDRKIGIKAFVSTFFYLIEKNVILVKKEPTDIECTYLKEKEEEANLSLNEQYFLSIFFGGIGSKEKVKLSEMISFSKYYSNRTNLLMEYTIWKRIAYQDVKEEFFEQKKGYRGIFVLAILGFLLILFNFIFKVNSPFIYTLFFPICFLYFYFKCTYKRTKEANTEYFKWTAYKRYILNLSVIKDIPYFYIVNLIGLHQVQERLRKEDLYFVEMEKVITKMLRDAVLHGGRSL